MTRSPWIAGTMMSAAITTGCMMEPESEREVRTSRHDYNQLPANDDYQLVRGARDAMIRGTVGPVTLDSAARPSVYDDGWYLSVESVVELEDRAAMTLLSVSNGADIFKPGLSRMFRIEEYAQNGASVTLLGCVGQEVGIYDEYDMPADEVQVDISQGNTAAEMDVDLTARWFDRNESGERLATFSEAATEFTLVR